MALTALFTGASGLAANSTALDVVGNNLANLNTTGYKNQRVLFQDQVYQLLNLGSSGDGGNVGGTNASQIGYGVVVGSVGNSFQQGPINPTARPLDAAIQGGGFFVLRGETGRVFTRAGSFGVDSAGFLVDPSTGARVQRNGTIGEGGPGTPGFQVPGTNDIRVPFGAGATGTPTSLVRLQGNLNRAMSVGQSHNAPIQIYDSQSGPQTLNILFTKTAINTYSVSASINGATVTTPPTPVTFDGLGNLVSPGTLTINISGIPGTDPQNVTLNLGTPGTTEGLSQFGDNQSANPSQPPVSTASAVTQDGIGAGSLTTVSIDANGIVQGSFTNGRTIPLAQLALASFNNEGGLIRTGQNYYTTGPGSGEPFIGGAGSGGRGVVQGAALEGSNVDIAIEFSRLILAQRGFQVNSRTISVANDTLQELANVVR
ncbi:MAG: flagellar hook-basal body complex protein [Fimbriiglobus sp.]|jgi:flagellar hook protein FlgE|nr:flagellar hook-basal body complex protein [Fimbriiglobus sp.]